LYRADAMAALTRQLSVLYHGAKYVVAAKGTSSILQCGIARFQGQSRVRNYSTQQPLEQ
jgi:hypothetical protein